MECIGGTIYLDIGGYLVHVFTSSGTFVVADEMSVEVLVVAGGGAGGTYVGGGGGAGGVVYNSNYTVSPQTYTVTIGNGGASTVTNTCGANGEDSIFDTLIAIGGGGGGSYCVDGGNGQNGGSGGGVGWQSNGVVGTGIAGQGYSGGVYTANLYSGGGGGAGSAGGLGYGGDGTSDYSSILSVAYAGIEYNGLRYIAGGGGAFGQRTNNNILLGGKGGGGAGGSSQDSPYFGNLSGCSGLPNTGSGGGGGHYANYGLYGGSGGSGIIIIRYPFSFYKGSGSGGAESFQGDKKIHTFTSTSPFTITKRLSVEVLVVAGGGGGGCNNSGGGGGGGGGGLVFSTILSLEPQEYTVIVGNGGNGASVNSVSFGSQGEDSSFSSIIAEGGGAGAGGYNKGGAGGSGGGGSPGGYSGENGSGGDNTTSQGNIGGIGVSQAYVGYAGGGGGGAGSAGGNSMNYNSGKGGNGGSGLNWNLLGTYFAAGGGGGGNNLSNSLGGLGGVGGGGNGGKGQASASSATGYGCGGGGSFIGAGGNGSSGIVIIRYIYEMDYLPIVPILYIPGTSPWLEAISNIIIGCSVNTPLFLSGKVEFVENTINSLIDMNPMTYSYQQQIPIDISSTSTLFVPSFNCTYIPPTLTFEQIIYSLKATPFQEHIPLKSELLILFEALTDPYQQNIPFSILDFLYQNPTCYRPPIITGTTRTVWTRTENNPRFVRSEV